MKCECTTSKVGSKTFRIISHFSMCIFYVHFLCALEGDVGKRNNIASIWFISVKREKFIRFYRPYVTTFRFNLTVYHTSYAEHLFLLFLFLIYLLLYLLFLAFIYISIPAIAVMICIHFWYYFIILFVLLLYYFATTKAKNVTL